ncbi:MAG: winged helix-turn-helix domain-containing protein [Oscillospiraceae bacterium]|nr:winged helix-turn-helix domain-containing protein [Oscillospiraceae bacterium]
MHLNQKIEILSKKTIGEKLLSYLHLEARRAGCHKFTISFSRQKLADYLCVYRSGMSRELSNMKKDQIITFERNEFEIYDVYFD